MRNSVTIYTIIVLLIGKHRTDRAIGDSGLLRLLMLKQQFLAALGYQFRFKEARIQPLPA